RAGWRAPAAFAQSRRLRRRSAAEGRSLSAEWSGRRGWSWQVVVIVSRRIKPAIKPSFGWRYRWRGSGVAIQSPALAGTARDRPSVGSGRDGSPRYSSTPCARSAPRELSVPDRDLRLVIRRRRRVRRRSRPAAIPLSDRFALEWSRSLFLVAYRD